MGGGCVDRCWGLRFMSGLFARVFADTETGVDALHECGTLAE